MVTAAEETLIRLAQQTVDLTAVVVALNIAMLLVGIAALIAGIYAVYWGKLAVTLDLWKETAKVQAAKDGSYNKLFDDTEYVE